MTLPGHSLSCFVKRGDWLLEGNLENSFIQFPTTVGRWSIEDDCASSELESWMRLNKDLAWSRLRLNCQTRGLRPCTFDFYWTTGKSTLEGIKASWEEETCQFESKNYLRHAARVGGRTLLLEHLLALESERLLQQKPWSILILSNARLVET